MTGFSDLPLELRSLIWSLTVEPRTIEGILYATSPTPVPAALQACYEARSVLAQQYSRAFGHGAEPRHVWVNFEMNTISVGESGLGQRRRAFRRLEFMSECDEYYFHEGSYILGSYTNVVEIYVHCLDHPGRWRHGGLLAWPCPKENMWLINPQTGEMITAVENERNDEEEFKEWSRLADEEEG